MNSNAFRKAKPHNVRASTADFVLGTIERINEQGEVFVDFPGCAQAPLRARLLLSAGAATAMQWCAGSPVMLLIDREQGGVPLIVGIPVERIPAASAVTSERQARLDGRSVVLEAQTEIVLRCGKGSITLTADGKIVIKGTELVSRASGSNKIKGALVNIN